MTEPTGLITIERDRNTVVIKIEMRSLYDAIAIYDEALRDAQTGTVRLTVPVRARRDA